MEAIIAAQQELHGRIARTYENVRKAGSAKITTALISTTLRLLDSKWAKFEAQHESLRAHHWNELRTADYYLQDFLGQTEELYVHQRAVLLELEEKLKEERTELKPVSGGMPPPPRTTLPRIQLPQFSGRYEDWPSFRDLFRSLIVSDPTISDVTRLHYLKTSLKGEAEAMVKSLSTTEENFGRAWQVLIDYYENTRLLVRSYYSAYTAISKVKADSPTELRKLFHSMTSTVGSLESIGRPITSSEDLFVFLTVELLDARSRREWENSIGGTTEPPTYAELRQFLERRLHTLEAMQPAKTEATRAAKSAHTHHAQKAATKKERERCSLCRKDHFLMMCETFRKKPALERRRFVEDSQLCSNCLGKHKVNECKSQRTCTVCEGRHHSALHEAYRASASDSRPAIEGDAKTSHVARHPAEGRVAVLLATARIYVGDRSGGRHPARALIDQGSETSIVTEALAQRLRLPRKKTAVAIFGVGGQQTGVARGQIELNVTSNSGEGALTVRAIVLPRLTVYAGVSSMAVKDWPHLRDLELADPEYMAADDIDVLLGADAYAAIVGPGMRKGGVREPIAQQTSLGWTVSGAVDTLSNPTIAAMHQCSVDEPLVTLVQRFWEQEEITQPRPVLTAEEEQCEEFFARTHSRDRDGRYTVRLPIDAPLPDLAATRGIAKRVLEHVERRLARDELFGTMYRAFMEEYARLGHMSRVGATLGEDCRVYLPHHGVLREASSSTKLRVVFNGSAVVPGGESLNGRLRVGANLLPSLADVLLRWRRHRYVFAADIEKMYRQIRVHPSDRDLQRILWRDKSGEEISEYRLNTVTYGLACAPFLAIRTLHQLADDEGDRYPLGARVMRGDVYVDDVLSGADTLEEAMEVQRQVRALCTAGGFPLKKWAVNERELLGHIPEEDWSQPGGRAWLPNSSHSALGLQWHPGDDAFSFAVRTAETRPLTKRTVLSQSAQLFDPLGWLAPVVVRAKILFQRTWLQGLEWDAPLPTVDAALWRGFLDELPGLACIRVPRWLHSTRSSGAIEVHGFADASERAYAAAVYLRTEKEDVSDQWTTTLVTAKTKVTPLKQVSLPRLELCAATLLARLVVHVRAVLGLTDSPTFLWSDSTVALGWIRGHPSRWKTFVANRVSEIQTTLPEARWLHVASQDNPADCASRGLSPDELAHHALWWRGPPWMCDDWDPQEAAGDARPAEELPEERVQAHVGAARVPVEEPELLTRYSTLPRLLRITAWCRRWLRSRAENVKEGQDALSLSADEEDQSLLAWVRSVQTKNYNREMTQLSSGGQVERRNPLTRLTPFVDGQGILRVGGRLKHSLLAYDEKHPIILPEDSALTALIVDSCHSRTLHGGVQQTLGLVRQRFWIPGGRKAVKSRIYRCLRCLRWRAAAPQQIMGDLPGPRVTPSRPFEHTGVDYAGPVMLRTTKGRGHKASKAFIAIFVCLSTRAVHVDVVSDYTAEAFLATLRRFVSRRGSPQVIYSDCGTNFVGAEADLRAMFTAANGEARRIHKVLADERIRWQFNPPAAPHFGGLWEAAVKSVKRHLRRVLGDTTLTFEEMATFLSEVEACLNSRPLSPLSDDPEDTAALTPGHFLVGTALLAIPEPSLVDVPVNRLSRWQHIQQMREHFWHRWSREYLHSLADRPKWHTARPAPKVGQLCLVRNEVTSPAKWPLARIAELHPGEDGRVRVVTVRTATSVLTRPLVKIVLLPPEPDRTTDERDNEQGRSQ